MTFLRRAFILLIGLVLLAAPTVWRTYTQAGNERIYQPPADPGLSFAVTPAPTATPAPLPANHIQDTKALRPGPVVVDLAHFNQVSPIAFQPLADALAEHGLGLRLWLSKTDPFSITNFLDYPDQSAELALQLADASALVVVSPFFLWTPQEIRLVERFVADGGRLLLISDPDLFGDLAAITNFIGEPFGVVFNDDYLYDIVQNDENFTHFFQGEFRDQAAALNEATIAFYGGRSIGGAVIEQASSVETTLSSLRTGVTRFTTIAIGGVAGNGSAGRVLALSDFDVLTEPYLARHDNRLLTEFVAGFLAAERRVNLVADFPHYLSKEVALTFGRETAITGELVLLGAQLQKRLEGANRSLSLTSALVLSDTAGLAQRITLSPTTDLIYLADYRSAGQHSTLLATAGITLLEETLTPEPTAQSTVTPMPTPASVEPVTTTATLTATGHMTTSTIFTATATPTPTVIFVLQTKDGLRLRADQTVLVLQQPASGDGRHLLAVLGADEKSIAAGVNRLLNNDFAECITGPITTFCPLSAADKTTPAREEDAGKSTAPEERQETREDKGTNEDAFSILLVDDNEAAGEGELSEADRYLQTLIAAGYAPDLWTTADQKTPTSDNLTAYDWVIWSNAAYATSELSVAEVEVLTAHILAGGNLTISSRSPLIGAAESEPSVVRDLVIDDANPTLVEGLPSEPIQLEEGLPPSVPLTVAEDEAAASIVLRRGPASDDADAPALFVVGDETSGARLHISSIALTWLPEADAQQLIQNLGAWMRGE